MGVKKGQWGVVFPQQPREAVVRATPVKLAIQWSSNGELWV